jgi:hypothetical protein
MSGQSALGVPQSPVDGEGVEAGGAPVVSERIEESVGGGVVGLSWGTEDAGERGKEDESGEVARARELVEMGRGVELCAEDEVELVWRERREDGVVDD